MDALRLSRLAYRLETGLPRRRSLGVLALLGLRPLVAPEAAGAKKKRKKCKPCNRCPQRRCCSCEESGQPVSCFLVAPDQPCPCPGGGTTFEPVAGTANFCQTTNACARVACPVA